MKVNQLADRFGSNRTNAEHPGRHLSRCTCISIPFAGGMCEVPYMPAKAIINVNDLDRHVINLGRVVRHQREWLVNQLNATQFHPEELLASQLFCRHVDTGAKVVEPFDPEWAYHYFVCCWMTRGGKMGTDGEFDQGMSIRWKSGGGNSVVRFRSAIEGLSEWEKVARRCNFTSMDAFDMLGECLARDITENGVYCDPPWPSDGDNYTHKFDTEAQRCLAATLGKFQNTKIIIRYGDHPLIRELYPESKWTWHRLTGRTQANDEKAEVLITNTPG